MRFPLWYYLTQPIGDRHRPAILNPQAYWLHWQIRYLNRCWSNAHLEACWRVSYAKFVIRHRDFCQRMPLEEDPRWLVERCWHRQLPKRMY